MAIDNPSQLSFEQPRSAFGTWIGVVLLFVVFGLFVWVVMGVMPRGDNYEATRAKARAEKLKTASDEAATSLHSYGFVDKEKGIVRVPIERAMELTVADLAKKKPAPANPIATPAAAIQETAPVAPSPAPSVSPAASASPTPVVSVSGRTEPAAADNPPGAQPGTQPGASATPAATPPVPSSHAQPGVGLPSATPVQSAPGTPLPIPGKTP